MALCVDKRKEIGSSRGQSKAAKRGLSSKLFAEEPFRSMSKKNNLLNLSGGNRRLTGESLVPWSFFLVNLHWVGKLKTLFLPCFLYPVNVPFVWGKNTKSLQDPSRQEGFGEKNGHLLTEWGSTLLFPICLQYLYFIAKLFECLLVWCVYFHVEVREVESIYLHFQVQNWGCDMFKVTQKICGGVRNWSLILDQAAATEPFCLVGLCKRSSANFLSSISRLHWLPNCLGKLCITSPWEPLMDTFFVSLLTLQGLS